MSKGKKDPGTEQLTPLGHIPLWQINFWQTGLPNSKTQWKNVLQGKNKGKAR